MIEERSRTERESNENRSRTNRRTMRKIYRRNCWADCDFVSLQVDFIKATPKRITRFQPKNYATCATIFSAPKKKNSQNSLVCKKITSLCQKKQNLTPILAHSLYFLVLGYTNWPWWMVCLPYCIANLGQWWRHLRQRVHWVLVQTG